MSTRIDGRTVGLGSLALISLGCLFWQSWSADIEDTRKPATQQLSVEASLVQESAPATLALPTRTGAPMPDAGGLLQPEDLEYLGAFRLPDGPPETGWLYGGAGMAFYPGGDAGGPEDGFPGSLFATGHNWYQHITEIAIPIPVIPADHDLEALNTAETLQEFQDVRGSLYDFLDFEIPRVGLAYLPRQGEQASDKLYFCWHQHMGEGDTYPSHGWSELELANPETAGLWRIGDYWNYVTCGYMFDIPEDWAAIHIQGMRLATGRFRDGGQGARGPALFAIGPWMQGNPPLPDSRLPAIPLLLYTPVTADDEYSLENYQHSDEWTGGAWLTVGDKSAVIFVGTKGLGECWYGCSDGTVWPDEPPYPEACEDYLRGWWSTSFEGQMLFYNPEDLGRVGRGEWQAWEPQPYAVMKMDAYLLNITSAQQLSHVGAVTFDRQNRLLYIVEPLADGEKPVMHVWRLAP